MAKTQDQVSEKDAFLSYYKQSKLPDPTTWPEDSSVYVCASKRANSVKYDLTQNCFPLDGTLVHFDGSLFKGKIASRIKSASPMNLSAGKAPSCTSDKYFKGKSRMFQWTVQGMFKKRMRFDEVVTGQEFDRPFRNTPSASIVRKGIDLLKNRLPESFECDLFAVMPRFEHPLITGCQGFRIDEKNSICETPGNVFFGEASNGEILECSRLLGSEVPTSSEGRRKFFSKRENLQEYFFETHYVYTFEFYSNFFSMNKHRVEIGPFFSFDVIPYFNGYPLFFAMAKDKETGEFLFATEIWHKKLLDYEAKTFQFRRKGSRGS